MKLPKNFRTYHSRKRRYKAHAVRPINNHILMLHTLSYRERNEGINHPITVGILVADYRRSFCRENILYQLDRMDKKTGPLIDFYIPGYIKCPHYEKASSNQITFKTGKYRFSLRAYNSFLEYLEQKGINVSGRTQFLLVPYDGGHLWFKDALVFDLEKDEASGKIESAKLFFDFIIDISKKTTDFSEFQKRIKLGRIGTILIDFVKEQLPSSLWTLVTDPFSKLFKPEK